MADSQATAPLPMPPHLIHSPITTADGYFDPASPAVRAAVEQVEMVLARETVERERRGLNL